MIKIILQKSGSCYNSTKKTLYFNNFSEVKKEVVKVLDVRGWDNKFSVDMRSLKSCIEYLEPNYFIEKIKKSY